MPFARAEVFKKTFLAGAEFMFVGFSNKEKSVEQISKLTLSTDTCVDDGCVGAGCVLLLCVSGACIGDRNK